MKNRKESKQDQNNSPHALSRPVVAVLVLSTVAGLAYWNSFGVPFVFDDLASIGMNSDVQLGTSLIRWFTLSRPLLEATFAVNYAINGDNVWGYHLINFVLHLLNGILVYFLGRHIFSKVFERKHFDYVAALLAAAFFLVHPVKTESVTYISSRSELLSTFFYTLAVLLFARRSPGRIDFGFSLIVAFFFGLGMASKETVISLPAALLLYDFIFFSGGEIRPVLSRWRFYLTFVLGGVAVAAYLLVHLGHSVGSRAPGNLSVHDYFLTELRVIVRYVQITFLPAGLNLAYDVRPSVALLEPAVIASGIILLGIAAFGWWLRKRSPVAAFSIFWFFITLAPTSSVIPVLDAIFDHRLYLPLVGVCLSFPLLLILLENVARSKLRLSISAAQCGAVVLGLLLVTTVMRNEVWANEITLWSDVIAKSPAKARGYTGLAQVYYSRGQYEKAIEISRQGIRNAQDGDATFYGNIGQFYLSLARYDDALDAFGKIIAGQVAPLDRARAYYNIGVTHLYKREFQPAAEAFGQSLELDPNYLPAWDSYINVSFEIGNKQALRDQLVGIVKKSEDPKAYYGLAKIALLENQYKDAVGFFKQVGPAYNNEKNNAKLFVFNYALALENSGDVTSAIDRYVDALRQDPNFMQAHFNLAQIYLDRGQFTQAIQHFEQVLRIVPQDTPAHIQLARIFIQQGQRALAQNHLSAVLKVSPGDPEATALWQQTL
jgi:tetratricopeptide (TPR) repeat protein